MDLSGLTDIGNGALVNWAGIMAPFQGYRSIRLYGKGVLSRDGKTARRGAFMGAGLTILTIIPTSMMGIVALYFLPDLVDPYTAYPDLAINHVHHLSLDWLYSWEFLVLRCQLQMVACSPFPVSCQETLFKEMF